MKATTCISALLMMLTLSSFGQTSSGPAMIELSRNDMLDAFHDDRTIVAYHVEERINTRFGAYVTTYQVSDPSLIRTNDLGPNNTRKITPKYGAPRQKVADFSKPSAQLTYLGKLNPAASVPIVARPFVPPAEKPIEVVSVPEVVAPAPEASDLAKGTQIAYVNTTDTYERILNKGYRNVEMLKRVANSRFFDGDMVAAAKWYAELFALTNDLDESYYYRYAQSLKATSQIAKADELMAYFESRVSTNRHP